MFYDCSSLEEFNLSNFNTNNVTDMISIFIGCEKLKKLNISSFNFNKVKILNNIFDRCYQLKESDKLINNIYNKMNHTNKTNAFYSKYFY